jgi:hypothetical protein
MDRRLSAADVGTLRLERASVNVGSAGTLGWRSECEATGPASEAGLERQAVRINAEVVRPEATE